MNRYLMLSYKYDDDLEREVNRLMKLGYRLAGATFAYQNRLHQAMELKPWVVGYVDAD